MLKRITLCLVFILTFLCFLPSFVLYGQVPITTKTNNKPEEQTANSQKQSKIISDAAQSPMTTFPLSVSPSRQEITPNQPQHYEDKAPSGWWLIGFNGLLVIVVSFQVFWMIRQTKWMTKSGEAATESADVATETLATIKNTTIRQLRAYVFVDTIDIGNIFGNHPLPAEGQTAIPMGPWIFKPEKGPIAAIIIKNSGQTPAYNVVHTGYIGIYEYPNFVFPIPLKAPLKQS